MLLRDSGGLDPSVQRRFGFLKKCQDLKNKKVIEDFTCCDKWTDKNVVKKIAINYCADLIADAELLHLNPGCSIIII